MAIGKELLITAKKGANGGGTIRKKTVTYKDGDKTYTYWEARVSTGFDPKTGKPVRRSITGKTQKEVLEKMREVCSEVSSGEYIAPSKITVGQWLTDWLRDYCGDKKWSTVKHYKAQVRTHIAPAIGDIKLSDLSPKDIQRFYNQLLKDGRTLTKKDVKGMTAPLSAKSVRNIHGVLTKALSVAVNVGLIRNNPAERVTLPRVDRKEIVPLTDEQVKDLLSVADSDPYGAIFKLIVFTGLREAEATGLTWDCVDFETGRITVCKQLQKRPLDEGGFMFTPLKNDKVRTIAVAPFVMGVLEERRKAQLKDRLSAGSAWEAWNTTAEMKKALVFTNELGQHIHPQTVYNHLKKLVAKIGAPGACVHDLRHTFAVLSLQNGDDVKTVQGNLGHATAAFTLDVYGHVSERMKDESAARMQEFIESIKQA